MRLFTVCMTEQGARTRRRFNSKERAEKHARAYLDSKLPRDVGDVLRKIPSDDGFLRVFRTVKACRDDIEVDAQITVSSPRRTGVTG